MKELYKEDSDSLTGIYKELQSDSNSFMQRWTRVARKCVNYVNGDQTVDSDAGSTWLNGQPVFNENTIGKPSQLNVNEIEPIVRTMTSYLTRSEPTITVKPANSQDIQSKATAKVAEDVANATYDLDNEQIKTIEGVQWLLTVGTIFGKTFWDQSAGGYVQDQLTGEYKKTGRHVSKILTPFTIGTDWSCSDFTEIPYIKEDNVVDIEWIKEAYGVEEEGFTNNFEGMVEGEWGTDSLIRYEQFKTAVPYLGNNGEIKRKGRVLMTELFAPPNRDYPEGRMMVFAGGKLVYATPVGGSNPYYLGSIGSNEIWHPYSMAVYEKYLGRLLGKGLVEQLLPIQMRMNEIWATIIENANTIGKPNIIAAEKQLKKGVLTGEGFKLYTYQVIPGASEPHAFNGVPLPSQFFNELQSLSNKMVQVAGTNFVMQGNAPTGVTAASAISQLIENSSTQNAPISQQVRRFQEERFTKKLRVIKKHQVYPDGELNDCLKAIAKENYRTSVEIFVGQQHLEDNVIVKIEQSSNIPKSEQAKSEAILELVKNGFFGPLMSDPSPKAQAARDQVLEQLGLESIQTEESVDLKKAKWENERIMLGQPVEVSPRDINPIHIMCHREVLQNPDFLENATDEQKIALDAHLQEHEQAEAMAQMQAQQMAMQQQMQGGEADPAPPMQ